MEVSISTVFHVPALPKHLKKIIPLRQFERPQLVGYDMRTLRKQIDVLYNEMDVRYEEHKSIYEQNAELWRYVKALLAAHQTNAEQIKIHSQELRTELVDLYSERKDIHSRLLAAQGAQEMLDALANEREEVRAMIISDKELLAQAEQALETSEQVLFSLETEVIEKERRLHVFMDNIEQLRQQRREDVCQEKAEAFFLTSKCILKHAYISFKSTVVESIQCRKRAFRSFVFASKRSLFRCWTYWLAFIYRRRIMNRSASSRRLESKVLMFSKWKIFSALEKHFHRMRRRRLLRLVFAALLRNSTQLRWNKWALAATDTLTDRRMTKRCFSAWRAGCMLLNWLAPHTLAAEKNALRFFVSKLMRAWKIAANQSCSLSKSICKQVELIRLRLPFFLWKSTAMCRLNRREQMKSSFFRNVRQRIVQRQDSLEFMRYITLQCIYLKKLAALRRWSRFTQNHPLRVDSRHCWPSAGTRSTQALLRRTLLSLLFSATLSRRQQVAEYNAAQLLSKKVLRRWFIFSSNRITIRKKMRQCILHKSLQEWITFIPTLQWRRLASKLADERYSKMVRRARTNLLQRWYTRAAQSRVLKRKADIVHRRHLLLIRRRSFSDWRCTWGRTMFWREKESKIERCRTMALIDLKREEREFLEEEKADLLQRGKELIVYIESMQLSAAEKDKELNELREKTQCLQQARVELESSLEETRRDLETTRHERERLRAVETMFENGREREERDIRRRREQAEGLLTALRRESEALKTDMEDAREQAYLIERQAKRGLNADMELLSQSQLANSQLKELVYSKKAYLEELEGGISNIQHDMERIQSRIQETTRSGISVLDEGEAELRQKSLRVKYLRSEKGLAEARVAALRESLRLRSRGVVQTHLTESLANEAREISEIKDAAFFLSQSLSDHT